MKVTNYENFDEEYEGFDDTEVITVNYRARRPKNTAVVQLPKELQPTPLTPKGSTTSPIPSSTALVKSPTTSAASSYNYGNANLKKAFVYKGTEFWGSCFSDIERKPFDEDTIIICCNGRSVESSSFVKSGPEWLLSLNPLPPKQIVFDWKDFGVPPAQWDFDKWSKIAKNIIKDYKKVIICCQAGKGRTGTLLSIMYSVLNKDKVVAPMDAINFIRENYYQSAVENFLQEKYVINLLSDNFSAEELKTVYETLSKKSTTTYSYQGGPPHFSDGMSGGPTGSTTGQRNYSDRNWVD